MVRVIIEITNIAAGDNKDCIIFLKHGEAFYQKPSKGEVSFVEIMVMCFPFNMLILMEMAKQT